MQPSVALLVYVVCDLVAVSCFVPKLAYALGRCG